MPKEPKIKELLKSVGLLLMPSVGTPINVKNTLEYRALKQAIKSLRKEKKRLKKEQKLVCYINPEYAGLFKNCMPVAEFKCAKTNKPPMGSRVYPVIKKVDGRFMWGTAICCDGLWDTSNIVSYSEIEPSQIVDALNKEK